MTRSPYDHMQAAVDIVSGSPHPVNKIAATLAGEGLALSRTNHWPQPIAEKIGTDAEIGDSSGTVHAEAACILDSPQPTEGASLFVTDPPCPNCAKYLAEAGIRALYIDHKGFDKDWAKRRGGDFAAMSLRICAHAGIGVTVIHRKDQKLEPIFEPPDGYAPPSEAPPLVEPFGDANEATDMHPIPQFLHYVKSIPSTPSPLRGEEIPWAAALAADVNGKSFAVAAARHPAIGYTEETVEGKEGKYSFMVQPVNRVLMTAARRGLKIRDGFLFSSRVPTSRELVNLVAAGLSRLNIGNMSESRDPSGPAALRQLRDAGVLNISSLRGR